MIGISYWNEKDGITLANDLERRFINDNLKNIFYDEVPLVYCKNNYSISIRECLESDIVEIDTLDELKALDSSYINIKY